MKTVCYHVLRKLMHALGVRLSGGSVSISSTNPFDQPLIDFQMLTDPLDIRVLRECARKSRDFVSTQAFEDYHLSLTGPFEGIDFDDDDAVDAVLRDVVGDGAHPVSTAAMSPVGAQYGVVDPDLWVKKVRGLRVVDASVMVSSEVGCRCRS